MFLALGTTGVYADGEGYREKAAAGEEGSEGGDALPEDYLLPAGDAKAGTYNQSAANQKEGQGGCLAAMNQGKVDELTGCSTRLSGRRLVIIGKLKGAAGSRA